MDVFVLLFSNDTTQDANFILSAKAYIYSEFVPTLFPDDIGTINVKFESDGAGCFNSSALKGCQPYWHEWTEGKVEEVQVRHSVNGDGKTPLDGVFGRLGCTLRTSINNGSQDITNAETCLAAFEYDIGISGTTAAIFRPVRGDGLENSNKRLTHYHRIVLDRDNNALKCWRHSGFGKGVSIGLDSINKGWNGLPQLPDYFVTSQLPTDKSSTKSEHSTTSKQSRVKKLKVSRHAEKSNARQNKQCDDHTIAFERGLFKCQELDPSGNDCCRAEFTTKSGLSRHIASGKHRFPKRNMIDTAAIMVSGSDGMLRVGNRLNRSEDYGDINVVDGSGAGISEGNGWFCSGCSLKPERLTGKKMHEELRQELIRMFNDGESTGGTRKKGKQKYTSEEAMTELRGMKLPSGLLKFSSTSPYGKLLSASQISSFWSRYKTMNTAMNVKTNTEGLADIPEESVLNEWVDSALLDNESDGIISRPDKTGRGKPEVASM